MNSKLTILLLVAMSCMLHAQTNSELRQANDLEDRQVELDYASQTNSMSPIPTSTNSAFKLGDADGDGMEDSWETQNGLDPNDPHDAWWDKDGDQVLNLFEFQLSTDVSDPTSPQTFDFTPNIPLGSIYTKLDLATSQPVLVRLSEGTYNNFEYERYFDMDYDIMVQGGWDASFTNYDPKNNRTILKHPTERVMILATDDISNSTIVLDGIEVVESGDNNLGGGIHLRPHSAYSYTSVYNCRFVDNNYYGLAMTFRDQAVSSEVYIANSLFGRNASGGIYTQVNQMAQVVWKLYNNTIHNPGSSQGGIKGFTLANISLAIYLENTINWGNTSYSFTFNSGSVASINVKNSSVDNLDPGLGNYSETNNINTDPLFVNVAAYDFGLSPGSPCLDAGVLLGLPYEGAAPDIGMECIDLSTGTLELAEENAFAIQPNLHTTGISSFNVAGLEAGIDYTVDLVDVFGRLLWSESFVAEGGLDLLQPHLNVPTGLYYAVLKTEHTQFTGLPLQVVK